MSNKLSPGNPDRIKQSVGDKIRDVLQDDVSVHFLDIGKVKAVPVYDQYGNVVWPIHKSREEIIGQ